MSPMMMVSPSMTKARSALATSIRDKLMQKKEMSLIMAGHLIEGRELILDTYIYN
jgi:hypothetical protein